MAEVKGGAHSKRYLKTHLLDAFSHTLFSETNLKVRQALSETHDRFVLDAENGSELLKEELNKFDGVYASTSMHACAHHAFRRLRGVSSPEPCFICV